LQLANSTSLCPNIWMKLVMYLLNHLLTVMLWTQ